jgi:hypothetical protein
MAGVSQHAVDFNVEILSASPDVLELSLPTGAVQFVRESTEKRVDGSSWRGHVVNDSDHMVQLTQHEGMLAGLISLHDATYEVVPVAVGKSALVKIQHDLYPACSGAHGVEPEAQPVSDDAPRGTHPAFRDRAGDVDVLIVYTATARAAAGGVAQMTATAQAAVDNANASFANSLASTRFNLVATREVSYAESGVAGTDLEWVRDSFAVRLWRNMFRADMVALITEDGGGGCGIGYLLTSLNPGFEASAVQVTARSCAVGNLTYAHEHGHNMGMHHNPESGGGTTIAPDAFGHWDNTGATTQERFRTVMSYACPTGPSCTRRMFFSNPSRAYMGRPTGITGQRNNTRIANHVADLVANFRVKTIMRHGFD